MISIMHKIIKVLFFLLAIVVVSCSEVEDVIFGGEGGKEPISFSLSDDAVRSTRGGFCGGNTFLAMRIQSVSEKDGANLYTRTTATAEKDATGAADSYSAVKFEDDQIRYWDDAHGQYSALSVYAVAIPNMSTDASGLENKLEAGSSDGSAKWGSNATNTIQWEVSKTQTKDDTSDNAAVVTAESGTIDKEDLVYSNNIQEGGEDGIYRWNFAKRAYEPELTGTVGAHAGGPMRFIWESIDPDNPMHSPSAQVGKFDKGHLVFKHALSRITVTLEKNTGFEGDGTFQFTDDAGDAANGGTITLRGMNIRGTLDLPAGTWGSVSTGNIDMGRKGTGSTAEGTFVGQMLPGYSFISNNGTAVMQFTIDGNTYYVTQGMLYTALHNKVVNRKAEFGYDDHTGTFTMMPGKNYQFEFLVKKRKVEVIFASLVPWEEVSGAESSINNARIKLQLEERGEAPTSDVAFYKAEDNNTGAIDDAYASYKWKTGYANLGATYSDPYWKTNSFWETSKDFYHFRALMPAATGVTTDADPDEDYATLTSAATYTDVCWGAPMLDVADNEASDAETLKWLYGPTKGGFDTDDGGKVATGLPDGTTHQIYKAIGATEDPVKLTLFHVMSDVTFNIKTTTGGTDKVELCHDNGAGADPRYTHTRLDLVGFYNGGKVLLGTGLVKTDGSISTVATPVNIGAPTADDTGAYTDKTYHFGAVPQDLTDVKLYITTPDGNQYIIDLKDAKATTITTANLANPYEATDGKYAIDRWYPSFKYNYSFTLKKTGIVNLQATVVDWETVIAADETVQIK